MLCLQIHLWTQGPLRSHRELIASLARRLPDFGKPGLRLFPASVHTSLVQIVTHIGSSCVAHGSVPFPGQIHITPGIGCANLQAAAVVGKHYFRREYFQSKDPLGTCSTPRPKYLQTAVLKPRRTAQGGNSQALGCFHTAQILSIPEVEALGAAHPEQPVPNRQGQGILPSGQLQDPLPISRFTPGVNPLGPSSEGSYTADSFLRRPEGRDGFG